MSGAPILYGLVAEFEQPEQVLRAAQGVFEAGYRRIDAYTPFPVDGLAEAIGKNRNSIPLLVFLGGLAGGVGGYFMQWYATVIDYPLNTGGRPLHSWPAYIPITFELTILAASLTAVISMLLINRLPQLYHSIFNAPGFDRASQDRFFLCIEAGDPNFALAKTKVFLESFQPAKVVEVTK